MTASAADYDRQSKQLPTDRETGPKIRQTDYGYSIAEEATDDSLSSASRVLGRFTGVILLLSAAGLWVLPDATYGAEVFGMKVAAMVMFTVIGSYLLWAGRNASYAEFQVDLGRREIRIGQRGLKGGFRQKNRLSFDQIGSVFLLRSKDYSNPTRLFLRLSSFDTGVEIATGEETQLEALRSRLVRDLAGQRFQSVERQLGTHQQFAA